jgi:transposase
VKGWLHTPIQDEASFNDQVAALCQLYHDAPKLHADGIHVISCDEKTGIQALEREITPMKTKQIERQDSSYSRHDTQCLIANFEVATGKIIAPTIGDTRTEDDFVSHIARTIDTDPDAKWIFIADNLNTHQSAGLVQLVIKRLGLEFSADDIGLKGKSGILQSMETRAKFLSDVCHNIQFVYTPKHASWLNQVEIWFGILVNRLLKRLSVKSTNELKSKILSFVTYFNETMAKAFKWTYKGKVLNA